MSNEFRVEIAPTRGDKLSVVVRADHLTYIPEAGRSTELSPFKLDTQEIDQLRRGDPPPKLVRKVTAEVSQWLIPSRGQLRAYLENVLRTQTAEPVRLVFSVLDAELRATLTDLPLELLQMEGSNNPLVLEPKVSAIVHLLPETGKPASSSIAMNWPLRVLIVRSNPKDLGGAVPEAEPIRRQIEMLGKNLGTDLVKVDLLSSEEGVAKAVTWEVLREQLKKCEYNILVYLGHGDLIPECGSKGEPLVGVLQLETTEKYSKPVFSNELAIQLCHYPVPVVLLIGCLTAAEVPEKLKNRVSEDMPNWIRGSQGVAQALVNSNSGVQCVVGMRYRLEAEPSREFLRAFFQSLLEDKPGNIEKAVRAGRLKLYGDNSSLPSWSAPVIFRTLGEEPMFKFLESPPPTSQDKLEEQERKLRSEIWNELIRQPLNTRTTDSSRFAYKLLEDTEQRLKNRILQQSSLIMPDRVEVDAGQAITVPIKLHGQLDINFLEGTVVLEGDGISIQSLRRTQSLGEAGYRVLGELEGNIAFFRIQRIEEGSSGLLPEGILFEVAFVGATDSAIYPVGVEICRTQPAQKIQIIRWLNNAVIVPQPSLREHLLKVLCQSCNPDELLALMYDLGVNEDESNLNKVLVSSRTQALISHFENQGNLETLVEAVRHEFPDCGI